MPKFLSELYMPNTFVHLRVHTEFSLVDSVVRIKPLIARVASEGMVACGVSDEHNYFGLLKFYKACQGAGVKPICGCDFRIFTDDEELRPPLLTLFARTSKGYKNIIALISLSYQEGQKHGVPYIRKEWLAAHSEGVIALSGAKFGDVGQLLLSANDDQAREHLREWMQTYPESFYLELQRTGRENDEIYVHRAVELASELNCPVVATNDVRFLDSSQFEVHEARVCIGEGRVLDDPRRERRYSDQQYFRSSEEMEALFSDIPEALQNSVEIAKRCNLDIELGKYYLPEYPIPEGLTENQFFEKICFEGMENRLERILDKQQPDYAERRKEYEERLRFELDIIVQMGFPGYFLIVMDFIQWAKDQQIPVGPGRGSGAGSLVVFPENHRSRSTSI